MEKVKNYSAMKSSNTESNNKQNMLNSLWTTLDSASFRQNGGLLRRLKLMADVWSHLASRFLSVLDRIAVVRTCSEFRAIAATYRASIFFHMPKPVIGATRTVRYEMDWIGDIDAALLFDCQFAIISDVAIDPNAIRIVLYNKEVWEIMRNTQTDWYVSSIWFVFYLAVKLFGVLTRRIATDPEPIRFSRSARHEVAWPRALHRFQAEYEGRIRY
jgi:hypothetical protein